MRIVIDGHDALDRLGLSVAEGSLLFEVLADLRAFLAQDERVIEALSLDGELLGPQREQALRDHPLGEFRMLDVVTNTREGLCVVILASLNENFHRLPPALTTVAEHLQSGRMDQAARLLLQVFGELFQILETLRETAAILAIDLGALAEEGCDVEQLALRLRDLLENVQEAIRVGDSVTISDVLEYEIQPQLEDWHQVIRLVHARAADGRTP